MEKEPRTEPLPDDADGVVPDSADVAALLAQVEALHASAVGLVHRLPGAPPEGAAFLASRLAMVDLDSPDADLELDEVRFEVERFCGADAPAAVALARLRSVWFDLELARAVAH